MDILKYKFNRDIFYSGTVVDNGGTYSAATINIPISLKAAPVDVYDVVMSDFVDEEVTAAINPIIDYDRVRFGPCSVIGMLHHPIYKIYNNITYNVILTGGSIGNTSVLGGSLITSSNYDKLGFVDEDIKYERNNITKSYLQLSFFDSDSPSSQNLLASITLYPTNIYTSANSASIIPISFTASNPKLNPSEFSEGYFIYYNKEAVSGNTPTTTTLYMKAQFNNAKTGQVINLMTQPNPIPIGQYKQRTYTGYALYKVPNAYSYFYNIMGNTYNSSYGNTGNTATNVVMGNNNLYVNLYQAVVV